MGKQPTEIPHQIGPAVADFTGRKTEIDRITTTLRGNNALVCISGMPWIGKSELAKAVSKMLSDQFRDGQIVVDFRGNDETPLSQKQGLGECIRAFVGLEAVLPDDMTALESRFHTLLNGKRCLLLFENVKDWRQISQLMVPDGCVTIVTSRSQIAGAVNVDLDTLPAQDSLELLGKIVSGIDIAVATQICELCGYLPLAIRAAGSLMVVNRDLSPSEYVNQLSEERTRLEKIGEEGVDIGITAVFNLAYNRLSLEEARVFGNLSVFISDFSGRSEEVICEDFEHKHLTNLVRISFVFFNAQTNRYRLHDLVRIFSLSLNDETKIKETKTRFAKFFSSLIAQINSSSSTSGQNKSAGIDTFYAERENIRSTWKFLVQEAQLNRELANLCLDFIPAGGSLLLLLLPSNEMVSWCDEAILIAGKYEYQPAKVTPLWFRALAFEKMGEYREAEISFRDALGIAEKLNNEKTVGHLWGHLGRILTKKGQGHNAIEILGRSKTLPQLRASRGRRAYRSGNGFCLPGAERREPRVLTSSTRA